MPQWCKSYINTALTCLSSWASAWLTDGWRTCTCNWDRSPAGTSSGSSVSWHLCCKPDSMGGDGEKVQSAYVVYEETRQVNSKRGNCANQDRTKWLIKTHFCQGETPITMSKKSCGWNVFTCGYTPINIQTWKQRLLLPLSGRLYNWHGDSEIRRLTFIPVCPLCVTRRWNRSCPEGSIFTSELHLLFVLHL